MSNRKDLNLQIRAAVVEALKGDEVRSKVLVDDFIATNPELLNEYGDELMRSAVSRIFQSHLRAATDSRDLLPQQYELFEGILPPKTITIEKNGEVVYVPYIRTVKAQRRANIELMNRQIDADVGKRDEAVLLDQRLDPLIERFGDLPVGELLARAAEAAPVSE